MIYICERLTHKCRKNITMDTQIRAQYRFKEIFGKVAAADLSNTKSEVSDRLGISIAQLNRIIRGESDPSGTQLLIIAEHFDLPVDELYADSEAVASL